MRGENAISVYNEYGEDTGYDTTFLFNGSIFLDTSGDIFGIAENYQDFEVVSNEYNKDAIEVPVFEMAYQLISSDDVVVGENIFNSHEGEDVIIMYGFIQTNNDVSELNYQTFINDNDLTYSNGKLTLYNACRVFYYTTTSRFEIKPYSNIVYTISNGNFVVGTQTPLIAKRNTLVYRLFINKSTHQIIEKDLMFICKKVPQSNINNNDGYIFLDTNIYKLK